MDRIGRHHFQQRLFQQTNRVMLARRQVLTATDAGASGAGHLQNFSDFMVQLIRRRMMMTPGREDGHTHRTCHQTVGEVFQQIVDGLFSLVQRILHSPVNQRQIGFIASFIVIAFQHRGGQIQLA